MTTSDRPVRALADSAPSSSPRGFGPENPLWRHTKPLQIHRAERSPYPLNTRRRGLACASSRSPQEIDCLTSSRSGEATGRGGIQTPHRVQRTDCCLPFSGPESSLSFDAPSSNDLLSCNDLRASHSKHSKSRPRNIATRLEALNERFRWSGQVGSKPSINPQLQLKKRLHVHLKSPRRPSKDLPYLAK